MLGILLVCAAFVGPPVDFAVDESFDGGTLPVTVGDRVTIRLRCRPGTGYCWHVVETDDAILWESRPPRFEPIPGSEGKVGAPEWHVFRYIVAGPGKVRMRFIHDRGASSPPRGEFGFTLIAEGMDE